MNLQNRKSVTRGSRFFVSVLAVFLVFWLLATSAFASATLPPLDGYDVSRPDLLTADLLYAESAILIDQNTGDVLFEKGADDKRGPASTTKVMTLLLAIEHLSEIDEYITIPDAAADIPKDSSVVPVKPGEQMAYIDLLYGLMLHSGNDAANAVAVLVSGSVDSFVSMMNQRAQELGCTNTHFTNAHGYTSDDHYTSVRDMSIIARTAMQNETFRRIVSAGRYTMPATNKRGALTLKNTNFFGTGDTTYRYKYGTGIKTGFTKEAGQCLVGSATNEEGVSLISVVFKSTTSYPEAKWLDSTRLMNYGFFKYQPYSFSDLYDTRPLTVQIGNAAKEDEAGGLLKLNALITRSSNYTTVCNADHLNREIEDMFSRITVEYTSPLTAPVVQGTIMGTLTFTPKSGEPVTAVLVADRAIEAAPPVTVMNTISSGLLYTVAALLAILLLVMYISHVQKVKRRKRRRQAAARRRGQNTNTHRY